MPFRSPTVLAVAALSLTQLIGWGATFWMPAVTGPAMASDLRLALPLVMAGPTVMLVVMAMVSWPLSAVFERYGARPIMVLGSPIGAAAMLPHFRIISGFTPKKAGDQITRSASLPISIEPT